MNNESAHDGGFWVPSSGVVQTSKVEGGGKMLGWDGEAWAEVKQFAPAKALIHVGELDPAQRLALARGGES